MLCAPWKSGKREYIAAISIDQGRPPSISSFSMSWSSRLIPVHKSNRKWVTGKQASFISRIATMNHRILIVATIFEMQTPRRPIDGTCPRRVCEFIFKDYLYNEFIYICVCVCVCVCVCTFWISFTIYIFFLCNVFHEHSACNLAKSLLKRKNE